MIQDKVNELLSQIALFSLLDNSNSAIKRMQENAKDQIQTQVDFERINITKEVD